MIHIILMLSNLQTDYRKRATPDLTPKLIATDTVTELRGEFLGKLLETEQHNVLTLIHKLYTRKNQPIFRVLVPWMSKMFEPAFVSFV